MASIIEIRKGSAKLRIRGSDYDFVDPNFEQKVGIKAAWDEYDKTKETLPEIEQMRKIRAMNKSQIKSYLPDMKEETLDKMGESEFGLVIDAIMEASKLKFGAVMEVVEKK